MPKGNQKTQKSLTPKSIDSFSYAYQTRNLEINLFWQRSNYFLVVNTAIAAGAVLKITAAEPFSAIIALFGMAVSYLWYKVNLGSKFWHIRWEHKLKTLEKEIDPSLHLFNTTREMVTNEVQEDFQEGLQTGKKLGYLNRRILAAPSVTRQMTLLSLVFLLFYFFAFLFSVKSMI